MTVYNPFHPPLLVFFNKILEYRHTTDRVCKVLLEDAKRYDSEGARYFSGSALIISDLSGPTDNGWELNFHTGVLRQTLKDGYRDEIVKLVSRECCLTYSQSFEAFETFLKDILYYHVTQSEGFRNEVNAMINPNTKVTRKTMPGGDKLFKALNKAAGHIIKDLFTDNNLGLRHKETFTALSQARHAIVHSGSIVQLSKVNTSKLQLDIFNYFFDSEYLGNSHLAIKLDVPRYQKLLKRFSEYAFQIFKAMSINYDLEYDFKLFTGDEDLKDAP